jgi:hypothetical protein
MSLEAVNRPLGGLNGNLARLGIDVTQGATPEDTILDLPVGATHGGKEIVRVHQAAMVASADAGGVFAFQNPLDVPILVLSLILEWTTVSSGACTLDAGVAADGTTLSDTLVDGQSVATTTGLVRSTVPRRVSENGGATDWVTVSMASGAIAGLAGRVYVEYIPIQ